MSLSFWAQVAALVLAATPGVTAAVATETSPRSISDAREELAVASGPVRAGPQARSSVAVGWMRLSDGLGRDSVTARVRRGRGVHGPELGATVPCSRSRAASSSGIVLVAAREEIGGGAVLEYSVTVELAAGAPRGTVLQSGVFVLVI